MGWVVVVVGMSSAWHGVWHGRCGEGCGWDLDRRVQSAPYKFFCTSCLMNPSTLLSTLAFPISDFRFK